MITDSKQSGLQPGEKQDGLTHVGPDGRARMVDVSAKAVQLRIARAAGSISLGSETVHLIRENQIRKGDVLRLAETAGILAAKQCPSLIPLCHTLLLTQVSVTATLTDSTVEVQAEVRCTGQTGVEMEALTAVSVALLTVYDMCKAVDKTMTLGNIHLIEKEKHDIL